MAWTNSWFCEASATATWKLRSASLPTSPLATLLACAVPLRVYWVMFLCTRFK